VALDAGSPLIFRTGVPILAGIGLGALVLVKGTAGEAGLAGVLSLITISPILSGCAAGLGAAVDVEDCGWIVCIASWYACAAAVMLGGAASGIVTSGVFVSDMVEL